MTFSELLDLPYNEQTSIVDIEAIRTSLPETPGEVAKQFLSDHGRNSEFQTQYGRLRLDRIVWTKVAERADAIAGATVFPDFQRWFNSVAERPKAIPEDGWKCIDSRRKIQTHWEQNRTWVLPPVLLAGSTMSSKSKYHLVEGHTRVGLLAGLVATGILKPESEHQIWLGANAA